LGFDTALWEIVALSSGSAASVTLRHVSPDGDMGFPGAVTVLATYCLNPDNHLTIDYRATTDRSTVVSVTNHAYWNLAGLRSGRSAMDHQVMIAADRYLPVDCGLIPTGELRSVDDSPFDFRRPYAMGARLGKATEPQLRLARGYDHTWVIGDRVYPEPRLAAVVSDPGSGRGIELWSNQPGLQLYSGHSGAIALEPQMFPDAPNRPNFRSARLEPGQIYRNLILYKLTTGFNPAD
jgi:aldose 1-epimerase